MIHFSIQGVPPSSNHLYANMRGGGGRILKTEGKRYKQGLVTHLASKYAVDLAKLSWDPCSRRFAIYAFYMPILQKNKEIARLDVTNRVKVVEDAVKDVTAIDDKAYTTVILAKFHEPKKELQHTEVWLYSESEVGYFVRKVAELHPDVQI